MLIFYWSIAFVGDEELVSVCLEGGISANCYDQHQWTPLMCASHAGKIRFYTHLATTYLILRENFGTNQLHRAPSVMESNCPSASKSSQVCQIFMPKVLVTRMSTLSTDSGIVTFDVGHAGIVQSLLLAGARIDAANLRGHTAFDLAIERKQFFAAEVLANADTLQHDASTRLAYIGVSPFCRCSWRKENSWWWLRETTDYAFEPIESVGNCVTFVMKVLKNSRWFRTPMDSWTRCSGAIESVSVEIILNFSYFSWQSDEGVDASSGLQYRRVDDDNLDLVGQLTG